MKTPLKPVAAWLSTAVLAGETLLFAMQAKLDFPFLAPALLAVLVIQIKTCHTLLELVGTVPLALGLALLRFGPHPRLLYESRASFGLFLGSASLFIMGTAVLRSHPREVPERIRAFTTALALPVFVVVTAAVLPGTAHARPLTLDRVLYAFDGSLGVQPSFVLGRMLSHLPWLGAIAEASYEQVPLAVLVLYASTMDKEGRGKSRLLLLFGGASLAGYLLYFLIPAAGPVHMFPSRFPNTAPPLAGLALLPLALPADVPRNAMPSLHMAWAVLMYWNARRSGIWLRAAYLAYMILTVLVTLGSGEHYLIDLVVALPFALAVQAASYVPVREMPRSLPFWAGTFATFAWLAFLRFAAPVWLNSAVLDWSLIVVTVAGSAILERHAYRDLRGRVQKLQAVKRQQFEVASESL